MAGSVPCEGHPRPVTGPPDPAVPSRNSWASKACRSGCSSAPPASSAPTPIARGATATRTSTDRRRRRGRPGRTTRSAPACTPRCATGTACRPTVADRRRCQGCSRASGSVRDTATTGSERAAFRRALQWLESYVETLDPADEPLGVERVVAVKTAVLAFNGRADRIDSRPGPDGPELAIVDYKTGRTGLDTDDARGSQALALYAFAAERVFRRPCRRVELHHLPSGTVAGFDHTPESLARQVGRAEETARDILAAERAVTGGADPDEAFPAAPGARCAWCDYRRSCPAGVNAPGKESWAAVERTLDPIAAPGQPDELVRPRIGRCQAAGRGHPSIARRAWQPGQSPQKVTSASSISKPYERDRGRGRGPIRWRSRCRRSRRNRDRRHGGGCLRPGPRNGLDRRRARSGGRARPGRARRARRRWPGWRRNRAAGGPGG